MIKALSVVTALILAPSLASAAGCASDKVTVAGDWGQARFSIELADDAAERAQGLMHVESMPRMSGMLFAYEEPQFASFWMRNTLIPLDMIFAGADGTIRHVHSRAVPHDETPIPGGPDIQYVLEINGGMADRLGISVGDTLQHPLIGAGSDEGAANPCE